MIKTYSELIQFETFIERYNYLKLCSSIGIETFGHSRYINQILYRSEEWKSFRREIIIRDNGCDLGVEGFDITGHAGFAKAGEDIVCAAVSRRQ